MAEGGNRKITIRVKTLTDIKSVEVDENIMVKEFRALVATIFQADLSRTFLIFAGKILTDYDNLKLLKITDGLTIHMVVKPVKPVAAVKPASLNTHGSFHQTTAPNPLVEVGGVDSLAVPPPPNFMDFIGAFGDSDDEDFEGFDVHSEDITDQEDGIENNEPWTEHDYNIHIGNNDQHNAAVLAHLILHSFRHQTLAGNQTAMSTNSALEQSAEDEQIPVCPDLTNMLANHEVRNSLQQIQHALYRLHSIAPDIFAYVTGAAQANTNSDTTNNLNSSDAAAAISSTTVPRLNNNNFTYLLRQLANNPPALDNQLQQLFAMGFSNLQANIEALNETSGNVNAAIELLLARHQL